MAKIIDFRSEKKSVLKKCKSEVDAEIREQDLYKEYDEQWRYNMGYIKCLIAINAVLFVIIYLINMLGAW